MTTVVAPRALRRHDVAGRDTGIATARDIAPRDMTVAAEATVGVTAVAGAAAAARVAAVIRTMARRARKSSWKDCRWIWWKKTLDHSFLSLPSHSQPVVPVVKTISCATFPATLLEDMKLRCACRRAYAPVDALDRSRVNSRSTTTWKALKTSELYGIDRPVRLLCVFSFGEVTD